MNFVVIGGGGHGRVVITTARLAGMTPVKVFDDAIERQARPFCDVAPGGAIIDVASQPLPAHIAIGSNPARRSIVAKLPGQAWVSVVHPSAIMDVSAECGAGTLFGMGAMIQAGARVGDHSIINTGAIVEHDCQVGDFCHLAPGSVLGGDVRIEDGVIVGLGARILPGIRIGRNSIVGAGAVVHRDVAPGQIVVGVPARPMKVVQ